MHLNIITMPKYCDVTLFSLSSLVTLSHHCFGGTLGTAWAHNKTVFADRMPIIQFHHYLGKQMMPMLEYTQRLKFHMVRRLNQAKLLV